MPKFLVFRPNSMTDCISLTADTILTSLHCDRQGARLLVSLKELSKFVQERVRLQGYHDKLKLGALELINLSSTFCFDCGRRCLTHISQFDSKVCDGVLVQLCPEWRRPIGDNRRYAVQKW